MGGGAGGPFGWLKNTLAVASLGTVNPNKEGIISGGVFEGKRGAADYGQTLGSHLSLGISKTADVQRQEAQGAFSGSAQTAAEQVGRDQAAAALSREAEARQRRAVKAIHSVLTGGLGVTGAAPSSTATLQPGGGRKSVLGV